MIKYAQYLLLGLSRPTWKVFTNITNLPHMKKLKLMNHIGTGGLQSFKVNVKPGLHIVISGRKHRRKHVSDSVPSSSDTRGHFDYNIASLTGIVINCSVSSNCNDRSNH